MKYRVFRTLPLFVVLSAVAFAQDLASFEKRITVKKLNNGLTVVICERPEAPVFAFFTHVDAGSVQDPLGETGLAHMFEHMAFKGTDTIGTSNYAAEKVALAQVEKAYAADKYVVKGQFDEIVERNGGVGINASTGWDSTQYFYSFPVNRLELWAYLE